MTRISKFFIIIIAFIVLPAKSADDYYELALKSFQQTDINSAEIHLKNALKNNPKNLPAKLLLAEVLIEKKLPH